jgi:predicted DNA-binding transcriptional regulator YafY
MFWDRGHWYLVGATAEGRQRLWRSDRIVELRPDRAASGPAVPFDVRDLLERSWLKEAMERWLGEAPVTLRLSQAQAARLQRDWYYRQARFEPAGEGVMMTFGEDDPEVVLALVRWLGPGAELLSPRPWREKLADELRQMLTIHEPGGAGAATPSL